MDFIAQLFVEIIISTLFSVLRNSLSAFGKNDSYQLFCDVFQVYLEIVLKNIDSALSLRHR